MNVRVCTPLGNAHTHNQYYFQKPQNISLLHILEVILNKQIYTVGVVMITIHILSSCPQIFGCNLEARSDRIEDISERILTSTILIIRIIAVLMLYLHH